MPHALAFVKFPRRDAFTTHHARANLLIQPAKSARKKAIQAPKVREQMEENARRAAARHLLVQEMRSRHQIGTPVPMWQAPTRMRPDLDDPEGEQEVGGDSDYLPEDDIWQEPLKTELPELTPDESLAPDETAQEIPLLDHQRSWEADELWHALIRPLRVFSSPSPFVENSAAFCYDQEAAKVVGRSFEEWMSSLETFYCTFYTFPPESPPMYCGRASTRRPCLRSFRPRASTSPQIANPVAQWWRTLAT